MKLLLPIFWNYIEWFFSGKLYLYLGQREFISCEGELDDIKGIAFVPEHVGDLKGNLITFDA